MRRTWARWLVVVLLASVWAACGGSPTQPTSVDTTRDVPPVGTGTSGPPARPLTKTSFVAFGDSITAGVITTLAGLLRLVVAPESYPYKVENLLTTQHPDQRIHVYNEGLAGEDASQGVSRLPGVLSADSPQVVLLLEGVNDLNFHVAIPTIIGNVQTEIQEAQAAGATVLVGTLLPEVRGEHRAYAPDDIQPFNEQLRATAASLGVTVVDLYTPFSQDLSLIGPDGLHPNANGYTKMAEIWTDAINTAFSIPLPGKATPPSP